MTDEQIENAAQESATYRGLMIGGMTADIYQYGFRDGANFALSHQWVSVEDALPEEGREVLLYDASSSLRYVIGRRRKKGDNKSQWALTNGYVEDESITHWLPIPKLNPEKDEK